MNQQKNRINYSPLRYPGGKANLKYFLIDVILKNGIAGGTYIEPYSGGSGAALALLFSDYVYDIILNDKDRFIYSFWYSVLHDTERLCKKIYDCPVTIEEWEKHHKRINNKHFEKNGSILECAFTCFFLNRANRSGVLKSGAIGGINQTGNYKIDARFNKTDLIDRIQKIALFRNRIKLYNLDAITFLKKAHNFCNLTDDKLLMYLDPPYDIMGKQIYRHYYKIEDHQKLSFFLLQATGYKWLLSYDDTSLINKLYQTKEKNILNKNYFLNQVKVGKELLITSDNLILPDQYQITTNERFVKVA